MTYNRESNAATLAAVFILIVVIAAFAVGGFLIFGGEAPEAEDEYPWIISDEAAKSGMLDGNVYDGEKNPAGRLSYKIAGEITVSKDDGKGNFKIENSGKNACLIKVKIVIGEETIYETGYIKPNQHIGTDVFDTIPRVGTYEAEAIFEGFDPDTEESIGAAKEKIFVTVLP